ncbi:hypothetical protein SDC9_89808 [bioreactor metagenome]|uniref:Uncharacterized protein n=1 Tax=bioreactor metagenome TaxID=1076179 RepID=A0A644ZQG7_9ZZZZ
MHSAGNAASADVRHWFIGAAGSADAAGAVTVQNRSAGITIAHNASGRSAIGGTLGTDLRVNQPDIFDDGVFYTAEQSGVGAVCARDIHRQPFDGMSLPVEAAGKGTVFRAHRCPAESGHVDIIGKLDSVAEIACAACRPERRALGGIDGEGFVCVVQHIVRVGRCRWGSRRVLCRRGEGGDSNVLIGGRISD